MHRISITVEPAVLQLLKPKTNRSKYISDLILKDAYETHKDTLVERTKQELLKDTGWILKIQSQIRNAGNVKATPTNELRYEPLEES